MDARSTPGPTPCWARSATASASSRFNRPERRNALAPRHVRRRAAVAGTLLRRRRRRLHPRDRRRERVLRRRRRARRAPPTRAGRRRVEAVGAAALGRGARRARWPSTARMVVLLHEGPKISIAALPGRGGRGRHRHRAGGRPANCGRIGPTDPGLGQARVQRRFRRTVVPHAVPRRVARARRARRTTRRSTRRPRSSSGSSTASFPTPSCPMPRSRGRDRSRPDRKRRSATSRRTCNRRRGCRLREALPLESERMARSASRRSTGPRCASGSRQRREGHASDDSTPGARGTRRKEDTLIYAVTERAPRLEHRHEHVAVRLEHARVRASRRPARRRRSARCWSAAGDRPARRARRSR